MTSNTHLAELLDSWEDLYEQGQPLTADEFIQQFCSNEPPSLVAQLRQRIDALREMNRLLAAESQPGEQIEQRTENLNCIPAAGSQLKVEAGCEPIAGYTLLHRLGAGGFGEVWKARGPGEFPVALKFVRLDRPAAKSELRALDFLRSLGHANLLATFGSWQKQGWLIIAMELADETLWDRFQKARKRGRQGIPGNELLRQMIDAARGIDFLNAPRKKPGEAEAKGVQHRDIKPQNLLLVGGSLKVADFGVAQLVAKGLADHTGNMSVAYAAPEFFDHKTSGHSDQYSLAVTYCQLRGGRLPFEGNSLQMMKGHLSLPPDLTMLPEKERPIVAKALSKDPEERWGSCRDFVRELCGLYGAKASEDDGGSVPEKGRSRRASQLAVVLLVGIILATGAWQLAKRRTPTPGPGGPMPPGRVVKIAAIPSQMVDEGAPLRLTVGLSESPETKNGVRFELSEDAPAGSHIDPASGKFTWTPSEEQGPAYYKIAVTCRLLGDGSLRDATSFIVQVNEVNGPPRLEKTTDQTVVQGERLRIRIKATDKDLPRNRLVFQLVDDQPLGAEINPSTGEFTWSVDERQVPGAYTVSFVVRDDGNPPQQTNGSFCALVKPPPPGLYRSLVGHADQVRGIAISADGRVAISGGADNVPRLWDIQTGQSKALAGHTGTVNCVAISPDGRTVVTGSYDTSVRLWNVETGAARRTLGAGGDVRAVAINARDVLFAGIRRKSGTRVTEVVKSWELKTGRPIRDFKTTSAVSALATSLNGQHIVIGSWDGTLEAWNIRENERFQFAGHSGYVDSVAFSPDERLVLSSSRADNSIRLWEFESRKLVYSLTYKDVSEPMGQVAFSPAGSRFVSGGNGLRIWETMSGKLQHHLEPQMACGVVTFAPDGTYVLSSGRGGVINLWLLPPNLAVSSATVPSPTEVLTSKEFIWSEPANLGSPVNSQHRESRPVLSADGLTLLFNSDRPGGFGEWDIWMSTRAAPKSKWRPPTNLGARVNSSIQDVMGDISADGLTLFFSSGRPGGEGTTDIWISRRETVKDSWGDPANLGSVVNSPKADSAFSLTPDGLTLFFTSDRDGGLGDLDIWMTRRPNANAPWGKPTNLGPGVNSDKREEGGQITSDGLILLFSAWQPGPNGRFVMWKASRARRDQPFGARVTLGSNLNKWATASGASLSNDGRTLFFHSNHPGGKGSWDLWSVGRTPRLRTGRP